MSEATISIIALSQNKDFELKITRESFEELCKPVFDRLLPQVIKALEEAKIDKTDINEIVMVGGSTYIPKVREILESYFEKPLNH
jgi:heat shock 70kDa protein 1/2/6/8